ncbi:unnamed protein product, partial [Meganyctiphanes norvegica]
VPTGIGPVSAEQPSRADHQEPQSRMSAIQVLVGLLIFTLTGSHVNGLQCYGEHFQVMNCDGPHDTCMVLSLRDSPAKRSCSTYIGCKGAEIIDNDIISKISNAVGGFLGEKDEGSATPLRCCTSDLCNGAETLANPVLLLLTLAVFWNILTFNF